MELHHPPASSCHSQRLIWRMSLAPLGKVARGAGWGLARVSRRPTPCMTVAANRHRRVRAFHTPSGAPRHLPRLRGEGAPRLRRGPSKRNVVVDRACAARAVAARNSGAAVAGTRRSSKAARVIVVGETVAGVAAAAGVEQRQFAAEALQHDFRRVFVGAALVLPLAGLQLALDVDFRALLAVLLRHLAEILVENHDVVPLGAFLALARGFVAPGFGCGEGETHHLVAGIQSADFWILAEIADEDHLVDAARHALAPYACVDASAALNRGYSRSILHNPNRLRRGARTPDNRTCPHFGAADAWEAARSRLHWKEPEAGRWAPSPCSFFVLT